MTKLKPAPKRRAPTAWMPGGPLSRILLVACFAVRKGVRRVHQDLQHDPARLEGFLDVVDTPMSAFKDEIEQHVVRRIEILERGPDLCACG